jgi:hypothetical protein
MANSNFGNAGKSDYEPGTNYNKERKMANFAKAT